VLNKRYNNMVTVKVSRKTIKEKKTIRVVNYQPQGVSTIRIEVVAI